MPGLPSAEELFALPVAELEAERTIRPVKVLQRGSGGAWRTLDGHADFAIVESYLSTAAKWGMTKLNALRDLFNGNPWQPPGLEPSVAHQT